MSCDEAVLLEEEEVEQFFDTREDILSSCSCPSTPVSCNLDPNENFLDCISYDQQYNLWTGELASVEERRSRFSRWMGLSFKPSSQQRHDSVDIKLEDRKDDESVADIDRMASDSGAELRNSFSGNWSSISSWSSECSRSSKDGASEESFVYRVKNLDDGTVFVADELEVDGAVKRFREVGSNRLITVDELLNVLGPSPFVQHFMKREDNGSISSTTSTSSEETARRRSGWLKRLGVAAGVVDRQEDDNFVSFDANHSGNKKVHRVRVHSYRKKLKEFSAVYMSQDIRAHEGAIWTMKFSPDGQYLASGGQDGIVRVWHVMESEQTGEGELPEEDPSCIYFMANQNFELVPVCMNKDKKSKSGGMWKTLDSACVVIPPNVFKISEKPLHEFCGHSGDILDLSWSKNKYLLSSSMDKTVRLWQVGCDDCIHVFPHNDYVTCVQFNPVEDIYFISGSIDGKLRIWDVSSRHVVDWTDIREIVTALCYRPDGKEVVVGSMAGNCRFYGVSDDRLQLETQLSLEGKKKSSLKRITGLQFSPGDPEKLMVTSADSRVRVLHRFNVVCKYKGLRNAGSRIFASFTKDGQHIISASEDSSIYIWNHHSQDAPKTNHVKSTWSSERFFSHNVSVAIPWHGLESEDPVSSASEVLESQGGLHGQPDFLGKNSNLTQPSSGSFTSCSGFLSEILRKGSATWPEEKLPSGLATASPALCKSQYKFLRTSCQNTVASPHTWGQVIVTAGWDGRIRSFHNYGLPVHT